MTGPRDDDPTPHDDHPPHRSIPPQPPVADISRRELMTIIGGVVTGMSLGALEQTIIATALPTIAGELGRVDLIAWIVTAYLLASTASTPLFGRMSDLFGRQRIYQLAILVFMVGSVLSGIAQSMPQLIVGRAVQGIGGGGLMVLALTIIGDVISPRERGRYQGYFGGVFAVATVAGPLLGGFFVDHLSWRLVFFIHLPICVVALIVTSRALRRLNQRGRSAVDVLGATLMVSSVVALLLAAEWGGRELPWTSPQIVGLVVFGVLAVLAFLLRQARARVPILPLSLFRSPPFAVCTSTAFVLGAALFGALVFLPIYLQVVGGATATNAGLLTIPLMGGAVTMAITIGRRVSTTGHYKRYMVAGTILMTVGLVLLSTMGAETPRLLTTFYMAVLGVGVGSTMPVLVVVVQSGAPADQLGIATSAVQFFRTLGGSVGTAVLGTLMSTRLARELAARLPADAVDTDVLGGGPSAIASLSPPVRQAVVESYGVAIPGLFLVAAPVVAIAILLVAVLPETPLRSTSNLARQTIDPMAPTIDPVAASADHDGTGRRPAPRDPPPGDPDEQESEQ